MPDQKKKPVLEDFEVETLFENRVHERHAFTFKVEGNEFKGHYLEGEILWLHPHPKQTIDDSKVVAIEKTIQSLMRQYGLSNGIEEFKLEQAFEERIHERQAFTLQVHGEEFKGFLHKGDIQWFHPQPQQKLANEHVEAIETEIREKIAKKNHGHHND